MAGLANGASQCFQHCHHYWVVGLLSQLSLLQTEQALRLEGVIISLLFPSDAIKKSDSPKVTAGQNSAFRTQVRSQVLPKSAVVPLLQNQRQNRVVFLFLQGLQKLQPGAGSQGATAR